MSKWKETLINLIILLLGKDGKQMMALLWAQEIMAQETLEEAKALWKRCPKLFKEKVRKIIVNAGEEELIAE